MRDFFRCGISVLDDFVCSRHRSYEIVAFSLSFSFESPGTLVPTKTPKQNSSKGRSNNKKSGMTFEVVS